MARVAVFQMEIRPLEVNDNLARVVDGIARAAAEGAELVLFPECALTGYMLTAEEAAAVAEPIPGPRTDRLAQACRQANVLAVVGTIEKDERGRCFNSAVVVSPEGVLARYRKTHLICLGVDRFLTPGERLVEPLATPLGTFGLLICYDLRFPEPARVLALAGAQAILLPTAWPEAASLYPDYVARTRANENGFFLLAANHFGRERGSRYLGRSLIVDPAGDIVAEAGTEHEALLLADLDLSRSAIKHRVFLPGEYEIDLVRDRRPELYRPLAETNP